MLGSISLEAHIGRYSNDQPLDWEEIPLDFRIRDFYKGPQQTWEPPLNTAFSGSFSVVDVVATPFPAHASCVKSLVQIQDRAWDDCISCMQRKRSRSRNDSHDNVHDDDSAPPSNHVTDQEGSSEVGSGGLVGMYFGGPFILTCSHSGWERGAHT